MTEGRAGAELIIVDSSGIRDGGGMSTGCGAVTTLRMRRRNDIGRVIANVE